MLRLFFYTLTVLLVFPTFAQIKTDAKKYSPDAVIDAKYGIIKYLENSTCPERYANTPSAAPIITTGKIARPSNPSVKLTALLAPTITI